MLQWDNVEERCVTVRTLAELEEQSSAGTWPVFVDSLPLHPGGVDPLGLRQLNFNLMDQVLPGINNVASRLRVYMLLAWAWWKAGELSKSAGKSHESSDRLRAFVDRMEVLFAVSHLLNEDFVGMLGRDTLNGRVVRPGGFDFTGPGWEKLRKDRALISSYMAPVAYGPSAKVGLGMSVIAPTEGGLFAPVAEVMPAVLALDAQLQPILGKPAFAELEGCYVSLEEMRSYYSYWSASDLTETEVSVGTARLYDKQNAVPRRQSIDLIKHLLEASDRALTVDEIRRTLASGFVDGQALHPPENLITRAYVWRALLARQLLRLSLESLLNWVLAECAVPSSVESLGDRLFDALGRPNHSDMAAWLSSDDWNSSVADPVTNPVELIEELEEQQQAHNPERAMDGVKAALRIAQVAPDHDYYKGQVDRLPLQVIVRRLEKMADLPFVEGLQVILSEWVIGQHIYWAVGRSGDDTQRLRLMLDEGGWLSFYANPGNARATPDRLQTVLRLMSDCRLCHEINDVGEQRYARQRLST
jgi:hypothetical protein